LIEFNSLSLDGKSNYRPEMQNTLFQCWKSGTGNWNL